MTRASNLECFERRFRNPPHPMICLAQCNLGIGGRSQISIPLQTLMSQNWKGQITFTTLQNALRIDSRTLFSNSKPYNCFFSSKTGGFAAESRFKKHILRETLNSWILRLDPSLLTRCCGGVTVFTGTFRTVKIICSDDRCDVDQNLAFP